MAGRDGKEDERGEGKLVEDMVRRMV